MIKKKILILLAMLTLIKTQTIQEKLKNLKNREKFLKLKNLFNQNKNPKASRFGESSYVIQKRSCSLLTENTRDSIFTDRFEIPCRRLAQCLYSSSENYSSINLTDSTFTKEYCLQKFENDMTLKCDSTNNVVFRRICKFKARRFRDTIAEVDDLDPYLTEIFANQLTKIHLCESESKCISFNEGSLSINDLGNTSEFEFVPIYYGNDVFSFKAYNGQCISIHQDSSAPSQFLGLSDCNGSDDVKWQIIEDGNHYKLRNLNDISLCMTANLETQSCLDSCQESLSDTCVNDCIEADLPGALDDILDECIYGDFYFEDFDEDFQDLDFFDFNYDDDLPSVFGCQDQCTFNCRKDFRFKCYNKAMAELAGFCAIKEASGVINECLRNDFPEYLHRCIFVEMDSGYGGYDGDENISDCTNYNSFAQADCMPSSYTAAELDCYEDSNNIENFYGDCYNNGNGNTNNDFDIYSQCTQKCDISSGCFSSCSVITTPMATEAVESSCVASCAADTTCNNTCGIDSSSLNGPILGNTECEAEPSNFLILDSKTDTQVNLKEYFETLFNNEFRV